MTNNSIPKISIVTPNYNNGRFIEECINSIHSQKYKNLEHIIIDGESTDNSLNIIKKYEHSLTFWSSESDTGQYDAINKGFKKSTGEIMGWLNSDDIYLPWTFKVVSDIFNEFSEIEWITSLYPIQIADSGEAINCRYHHGYSKKAFYGGVYLPGYIWFSPGFIQQDCVFWRRSLWEKTGGHLDTSYQLASDFDLWARFFENAELYGVQSPLSCFRIHSNQKSQNRDLYYKEAKEILLRYNPKPRNLITASYKRLFFPIVDLIRRTPFFKSHKSIKNILIKIFLADSCNICIKQARINNKWEIIKI